jgi:hypothetical protein
VGDVRVTVLREVLRHYQDLRSAFEADGVDHVLCPDGSEWSLWDVDYLLEEGLPMLPEREQQSIRLCLIADMREEDVAIYMNIKPTNPVAMYATSGLKRLFRLIDDGWLPRFQPDAAPWGVAS